MQKERIDVKGPVMKKNDISEFLGIFISLSGAAVMLGWLLDIGVLKSILPFWVTMKFSTAVSFLFSGVILYYIARCHRQDRCVALMILPISSMVIFLLMASLLASTIIGINVGVEEMFVREPAQAVGSVVPGRPSVATMINFMFIAIAGISVPFFCQRFHAVLSFIGVIVGLIGFVAILGYVIGQPLFYFLIEGQSSAMACHTAILFALWGLGLIFVEKNQ